MYPFQRQTRRIQSTEQRRERRHRRLRFIHVRQNLVNRSKREALSGAGSTRESETAGRQSRLFSLPGKCSRATKAVRVCNSAADVQLLALKYYYGVQHSAAIQSRLRSCRLINLMDKKNNQLKMTPFFMVSRFTSRQSSSQLSRVYTKTRGNFNLTDSNTAVVCLVQSQYLHTVVLYACYDEEMMSLTHSF